MKIKEISSKNWMLMIIVIIIVFALIVILFLTDTFSAFSVNCEISQEDYNELVDEYNNLIDDYNELSKNITSTAELLDTASKIYVLQNSPQERLIYCDEFFRGIYMSDMMNFLEENQ